MWQSFRSLLRSPQRTGLMPPSPRLILEDHCVDPRLCYTRYTTYPTYSGKRLGEAS